MSASAIPPPRRRELTASIPLRWGSYRERYLGGLWLIVGGGVAIAGSNTYTLWLLWAGTIAHVVGWCILPSAGWRRLVAVGPSTLAMWLLLPGPRYLVVLVIPYVAWLLVRHRPPLAYLTAVFVLAGAILLGETFWDYRDMLGSLSVELAIMVGSAWIARSIRPSRSRLPADSPARSSPPP